MSEVEELKELKKFSDYMKKLDSKINLKIEKKSSGGYLLHYSKRAVFGTKVVLSIDDIKEEIDEIFNYLNCSSSPKMYELKTAGLY